jgi:hypothetical protein
MAGSGLHNIGVDLSNVDPAGKAQGDPGKSFTVIEGNWYQYFKATGTLTKGQLVGISNLGECSAGSQTPAAGVRTPAGIVLLDMIAGQYHWLFRMGPSCSVLAALNCASGVALYTTAVAGVADDASTAGVIAGLSLTETITTARLATCQSGSFIMIN